MISGETSKEAAIREMEEEIGIKTNIDFKWKDLYINKEQAGHQKFLVTFTTTFEGPFKVSPIEVEKVEFFSLDQIQEMINQGEKFHPELLFLLEKYYGIDKK